MLTFFFFFSTHSCVFFWIYLLFIICIWVLSYNAVIYRVSWKILRVQFFFFFHDFLGAKAFNEIGTSLSKLKKKTMRYFMKDARISFILIFMSRIEIEILIHIWCNIREIVLFIKCRNIWCKMCMKFKRTLKWNSCMFINQYWKFRIHRI